jgi:hypothetical protein
MEVMPTPTLTTWSQIVNDFSDLWNFPNCIRAIDGKNVIVRSKLTKIPNQGGSGHQSAFEVRDKFKQLFNSPSGCVPWQNERV